MCRPSHDPSLWMHSEKKLQWIRFWHFARTMKKKINLLPKKFINRSPPFDQHFCKSTHANCWNFILICYCHFLLYFTETFMVSLNLYLKFFLLLTSEVFDKRSIRVRNESTWGLGMLQTIFKNYSRFRPSTRQFQGIKPCFHILKKVQKDSANDYALKYIVAL